ncbi:MAG: hypothetical protein IKD99_06720 [Erysipelotrichaceae bacterium]|nr:hypothetical protein [Erysipelotrichaceae bacterium]MBR2746395.1 hypothetical protein [Erysipelotrichaceae bacterium]
MNGISVPMAIIDFIPVVLFFITAVVLQRDLYNKMSKGAFALLAAGSIMVFFGGTYKALWKLLYALNVCDFTTLNNALFPMQGPGFLLVFLSLLGNRNGKKVYAVAPAVYASNLIFIIMQVVGLGGTQAMLAIRSVKMKKTNALICFVLSFIFMLGMGYLGSKFDDSSRMHWIAQVTNIVSQGTLLAGTMILHNAGLGK